ncbi:hypothetical protein [Aureispira anguillae]|uniref:Uncharacterized protein n=1 Tax=Aureispira anguillae TaxID=2864201 RepID=A0A915YLV4_9BACT|nr:hypothetical protein [Aureispira anguillae]BDS15620.1 hypothetical protein AsAng_0064040 [Aureispira anguillae]
MAKKKRSRTSDFSLGNNNTLGSLPSKEQINSVVAKATEQALPEVEKKKRIPFTTALTPENRALLEAASHEGRGGVADILNLAITHYFEQVAPIKNNEMKKVFLKIYQSKTK